MGSLVWGLFMCGLVMGLRFIYWGWVCIWGLLFTSVIWHQVTGVQCLSLILGSDLQVLCLAPGSISRVLGIVHNPSLHLVPDVWGLVGFGCGLRVHVWVSGPALAPGSGAWNLASRVCCPVFSLWHLVFCILSPEFVFGSRAWLVSRALGLLSSPGLMVWGPLWCPGFRVQSCIWYLKFGCGIQCLSNNGYWLQHQEDIQVEVQ